MMLFYSLFYFICSRTPANLYNPSTYVNTEAAIKKTIKEKKKIAKNAPLYAKFLTLNPRPFIFHHQGYHLKYHIPSCIPQD